MLSPHSSQLSCCTSFGDTAHILRVFACLQERLENAAANRFERAFNHTSKRYEKEVREVGRMRCFFCNICFSDLFCMVCMVFHNSPAPVVQVLCVLQAPLGDGANADGGITVACVHRCYFCNGLKL